MLGLMFADSETRQDLRTFVSRARSLDAGGAIRLQSNGMTLAAYVGVLPGQGPAMTGAVIGLRVMALGEPADLDVTVSLAGVAERLAKAGTSIFAIPPSTVQVGWAAIAPPRVGWEVVGDVPVEELKTIATQGIAEITRGSTIGSGARVVDALRHEVWSRDSPTTPPIPSGAAFAAYALGFLTQPSARVFAHGHWTRLSTETGHVLVR